jgi:hypothetical protein
MAKTRAKKRGMQFTVQLADLLPPPTHCPVFGVLINYDGPKHKLREPNTPSIDRLDNNLGYIAGNVRVISLRANILKNSASLEEVRALVRYMEILELV